MLNKIHRLNFCTYNILLFIIIVFTSCVTHFGVEGSQSIFVESLNVAEFIGSHVFFEILDPPDLRFVYRIQPAKDFGVPFNSSFQAHGAALVPVDPPSGCGWPYNSDEIAGNVALVERGECSFMSKAVKAEEVGAKAIIVADHDSKSDDYFIEMIDDKTMRDVHIPAGFLLGINGYMIRLKLQRSRRRYAIINIPVNMTYVPVSKIRQPPWLSCQVLDLESALSD